MSAFKTFDCVLKVQLVIKPKGGMTKLTTSHDVLLSENAKYHIKHLVTEVYTYIYIYILNGV